MKLLKTISSSSTNDIKGFAVENNYIAIVKRKKFNLDTNFTFSDSQNQKLYHLSKAIANEDNIIIYESEEITIFDIITNFELKNRFKTDDLPDYFSNSTKNIKLDTFEFNWNTLKNRPLLSTFETTTMKYGCGSNVKLSINSAFTFNSVSDIKIQARIDIESNFGGEFILPNDFEYSFLESRLIKEWSKAIPTIGKSFKLLGFEINVGAFFGLELHLSECKINIPVGFDYFKGYKLIGTKYYEVTPNSIMDSKWEVNLLSYPDVNMAINVLRSIASSVFTSVFTIKPFVIFQISVGSKKVRLDIGLQLPLKFEMKFNSEKCNFPYLQGQLSLPMTMFYTLHELKISFWTIWSKKENSFVFKRYVFNPFCIGPNLFKTFMRSESPIRTQRIDLQYMYDMSSITFEEDEMEIMLEVPVWEGFNDKYLNIYSEDNLMFSYEKEMRSFHETFFYIKLSSEPNVYIKVKRKDNTTTTAYVEFYFFDIVTDEIQTLEKNKPTPVVLTNNVLYPIIIPLPDGDALVAFDKLFTFAPIIFYIDDNCALVLIHSLYDAECNMMPVYTYIGELEPIVTLDLGFLSPLLDIHEGTYSYLVNCDVDVVAKIGERIIATSYVSIDDHRYVNLTEFGEITFIPICENETGIMCELTYPTPTMTGYHLVEYPNRDGISITGSGFLRELIPVEEGKNFTYYKTSRESVKIIKEYQNAEIRAVLKISVADFAVQEGEFKKICICREENNEEILPFSRTYYTEHMLELYDAIGLESENDDFSQVTNDENGCIVFPAALKTKDISIDSIPMEMCDIKIVPASVVDETIQNTPTKKKGLSAGAIAGIVVAVVVVVGLIVAVAVYFALKRKSKDFIYEDKDEDSVGI